MISAAVTYTVKEDRVEENERLVRGVYDGLRSIGDPDVHYATFRLDDDCTFMHIAFFPSAEKQRVLTESEGFRAFQAGLADRCSAPPSARPLTAIDSYEFHLPAA